MQTPVTKLHTTDFNSKKYPCLVPEWVLVCLCIYFHDAPHTEINS